MISRLTLRIVLADVALVLLLNSIIFLFLEIIVPGLIVQTIDITSLVIFTLICNIASIIYPPLDATLSRWQWTYVGSYAFVILILSARAVSLQVQGDLLRLVLSVIFISTLLIIIYSYHDSWRRH